MLHNMKNSLFLAVCFVTGVCVTLLLIFVEQKFHFKKMLIEHLGAVGIIIAFFLVLLVAMGAVVFFDNNLLKSPLFLGTLWGILLFLSPTFHFERK